MKNLSKTDIELIIETDNSFDWYLLKGRKDAFVEWATKQDFTVKNLGDIAIEYMDLNPRFPPKKLRLLILSKFNYTCQECGSKDNLQVDHIIPYSKGGWTREDNLTVLCASCNNKKRNF